MYFYLTNITNFLSPTTIWYCNRIIQSWLDRLGTFSVFGKLLFWENCVEGAVIYIQMLHDCCTSSQVVLKDCTGAVLEGNSIIGKPITYLGKYLRARA